MTTPKPWRAPGVSASWVMVNCAGETLTETASGGIAAWVLGVCRAAAREGIDIPVITKRHSGLSAAWEHAVEIDYPWPTIPGHSRVDRYMRSRGQYVHPYQPLWNGRVTRALQQFDKSCEILLHNDPELAVVLARTLPRHRVWHLMHNTNVMGPRWHAPFADLVRPVAVSRFIGEWLEQHIGLPAGTVSIVPGGVDSEAFCPGTKAVPPVISYTGLFNERKAPDLLLAACERVAARQPGLTFAVRLFGARHYGPEDVDDYGRGLRAAADRLRATGISVDLPGFLPRPRLAQSLSASSIHVVPSRCEEAFGLAALEGMACGAATVAANRGGLPEVIANAGVLVPPNDVDALAEMLTDLLLDERKCTRLGARGRLHAQCMSWGNTWRQLTNLAADTVPTGRIG